MQWKPVPVENIFVFSCRRISVKLLFIVGELNLTQVKSNVNISLKFLIDRINAKINFQNFEN